MKRTINTSTSTQLLTAAVFLAATTAVPGLTPWGVTAANSGEHAIIALVNDEPITAYEVEQRGRLLALNSNRVGQYIKENAKTRWEKTIKNSKINEEFRAYATKRNPKSKEELQKIQQEFVRQKQKAMMQQLQSEARSLASRGTEKQAIQELVEERLKLQEAKRNNVVASDDQIDKIITGIAERNKMTLDQFGKHMGSMGVDISTMRQRFRAMMSWNDVIRRKFGYQVAITERDVERFVDPALAIGDEDGGGDVQLKLQRILLPVATSLDQKEVAMKLSQADQARRKFTGCKSTSKLASSIGGKFEDLGLRQPASISEPARTLLLNAKSGEMIPPSIGPDGVELWAVCERKEIKAEGGGGPGAPGAGGKTRSAKDERRQKELDILARRHLKDLKQDATIDCRAEAKSGLCQAL